MRFSLAVIAIILLGIFSGCALSGTPGSQNNAYPGSSQEIEQPPESDLSASLPYPEYKDGDTVSAGVTVALLNGGAVARVTLKSNAEVILFLKDGRTLTTLQPYENALSKWIEECGEPCTVIEVTEE